MRGMGATENIPLDPPSEGGIIRNAGILPACISPLEKAALLFPLGGGRPEGPGDIDQRHKA